MWGRCRSSGGASLFMGRELKRRVGRGGMAFDTVTVEAAGTEDGVVNA